MAEGPQVRLRAAWLGRELAGRCILSAESPRRELAALAATLAGRRVEGVFARGDELFVALEGGLHLHNRLRAEGRWRRLAAPDAPAPAGCWLVLRLEERALANLHGRVLALLDEAALRTRLEALGVDVMDEPFREEAVVRALGACERPVGAALVDQSLLCGLGDVARSEVLFLAGIHPGRTAGGLTGEERRALAAAIASVTRECLAAGGRWAHRVDRRAGEACPRCSTTIELVRCGRPPGDVFLCPRCQPAGPALVLASGAPTVHAGTLRMGLAVWAHAPWTGSFFPAGTRSRDFLRLYAERLTAVEGNTTFYAVPPTETLERWRAETPALFRFCPKLPREITHRERIAGAAGEALAFLAHMRALGERLGPVIAQLPPSLGPQRAGELAALLDAWPTELAALAVEVRHPAWFDLDALERLDTLLAERGIGRAILDTRAIHEEGEGALPLELRKKPRLPVLPTAPGPVALVRFIAHPDRERSGRWMRTWVEPLGRWLAEGRDVYVFVHCPLEECAPGLARDFHALLERSGLPLSPLPWSRVAPPGDAPRQLSMF